MSRISEAFNGKKVFIPFITCGDPDLKTTEECVLQMVKNGAGIVELGIPFSDPTAEGPVIQEANLRALSGGITTDDVFDMVRSLRKKTDVPLVFMTYVNVVFSYGTKKFLENCRDVGMDGLILPDLPYEEKEEFAPACREQGIDLISLIAPTSNERIARIAGDAEGFLYIVSSLGVTGVRSEITTDLGAMVSLVRENTDIPCAIGFGISTPKQAHDMSQISDGAIIGSAIVRLVAAHGRDAAPFVGEYVKEITDAINAD